MTIFAASTIRHHSDDLTKRNTLKSKFRLFKIMLAVLALLFSIAVAIYVARLEAVIWYSLTSQFSSSPTDADSLQLDQYRVKIDALPVKGIASDLSGLSFNQETGTLFSVINGDSLIVEISPQGQLLRQIDVTGVRDMEGITHVKGHDFVISDEAEHRLILVRIDADTLNIDVSDAPQLSLNLDTRRNKSLEGVSWDENNQRLLVVTERNPLRVLQITGFVYSHNQLAISEITPGRLNRFALRDLSSVTHGRDSDNIILLSHESRILAEYDEAGKLLSYLSLWRGSHGLTRSIPQAEGVAIGPDETIYIISEPNLFYVFEK